MASTTIRFAGAIVALAAVASASQACGGGGTGGTGGTGGGSTTSSSSSSSSGTTTTDTGGTGGIGGTGGTGGTGTGGAGGMMPVAADTCAQATPFTLQLGDKITLDGTTAGAQDDYTSFCGDTTAAADTPDVVYAFTLASETTLKITVTAAPGSTLLPAIDLRTDCTAPSYCSDYGAASESFLSDIPAGSYYLVIDGKTQTSGAFTATIEADAPTCGDGVLNTGEQCDPGAAVANDGCGDPGAADACKYQAAPAGKDQCSGELLVILGGTTVLSAAQGYSTYGYADDYAGSCGGGGDGTQGRDRVFQLMPAKSGMLTVSVGYEADGITPSCQKDVYSTSCWDYVLYARSTCSTTSTELGCKDSPNWYDPETLTFPVTVGTPYFVFVDGFDGDPVFSTGPFNLVVNLQ